MKISRRSGDKSPIPWAQHVTHGKDPNRSIFFEVHARPGKASLKELETIGQTQSIGYAYSYNAFTERCSGSVFLEEAKLMEVTSEKKGSAYEIQVHYEGIPTYSIPSDVLAGGRLVERSPSSMLDWHCFDLPPGFVHVGVDEKILSSAQTMSKMAVAIITDIRGYLNRTYFISSLRGHVDPQVIVGEQRPHPRQTLTWVGTNGEHLIEILALCFSKGEYSAKVEKINEWFKKFGLGKIFAGWRGGAGLGSDFQDPDLKTHLELALASGGSRQILSIITQLFWSEPGDVIMIEEPEISLHPESQVLVQDLFATAVMEGKQIICSTHSPFLILALSKVIRRGRLSRDDIALYHVEKGAEGTKVRPLGLNQKGFVAGWIPSYLKIEDALFDEWAETLEKD